LLTDPDFVPQIYWWNEDSQLLEEVPTDAVGNVASTTVTHFSKYILLDKYDFDASWRLDIKPPGATQTNALDVVLVIDSSGSMEWNDSGNLRLQAANSFVDSLGDGARAAVIDFDDYATLRQGFTDDKALLRNGISHIDNYGGTDLSSGISLAIDQFTASSYSGDAYRCIVFLTDGDGTYNTAYTQKAATNGITVYTIGLGSGVLPVVLNSIADGTGGKYYYADTASVLGRIYDEIAFETIDYTTDSNHDGISDYYTRLLCDGDLTAGTRVSPFRDVRLTPDQLYDAIQEDDDYDRDGLRNGDELYVATKELPGNGILVYFKMNADPLQLDTDGDGLHDGQHREHNGEKILPRDPAPLSINGFKGIWDQQWEQDVSGHTAHTIDGGRLVGNLATQGGQKFCNVYPDSRSQALHSVVDTWQRKVGYNALFDMGLKGFNLGNSNDGQFDFTYTDQNGETESYNLWMWRAGYGAFGPGTEMGLYTNPTLEHWDAVDFDLPMTLSLYEIVEDRENNNTVGNHIENMFSWAPTADQWWITGFVWYREATLPVKSMITLGSIDFSEKPGLFAAFKKKAQGNKDWENYLIFDDDDIQHPVLWIVWYGDE
jgi:Mg-chelatase subunit ChlD